MSFLKTLAALLGLNYIAPKATHYLVVAPTLGFVFGTFTFALFGLFISTSLVTVNGYLVWLACSMLISYSFVMWDCNK